ncbi:MAG: class I SAM-dependent methyltransferase [Proteobacteria bacterium]|nr:class I SAM-dependent methyltransferase [Pseudomonadota bacterium]MBU1715144.1 class I SAM-dependent methyltransferase [Pseudomonadota bacterium]
MFNLLNCQYTFNKPEYLSNVYAWHGHIPFAFFLVELLRPRLFVELGTHQGDSYCAFCQSVKALQTETKCVAVDSWVGDHQAGEYGDNILRELKGYHDIRYGEFSTLKQAYFDAALADFADGSIDLLHIDGLHTYEAVKHDFETWLPKLSERAVVLFHDTKVEIADYGVWKFWEEISLRFKSFAFEHSSGLGILQVGSKCPEEFTQFMEYCNLNPDLVRQFFSRLGEAVNNQFLTRELQKERLSHQEQHLYFSELLSQKDQTIIGQDQVIQDKDGLVQRLNEDIQKIHAVIQELNSIIHEKDVLIHEKNQQLLDKEKIVYMLNERDQQVHDLEEQVIRLSQQNELFTGLFHSRKSLLIRILTLTFPDLKKLKK